MESFSVMDIELSKQLPVISMNYEEIKDSLSVELEKFKNIVVTEEGLKDCKATQKNLAKLRNKIDTYRKDVKSEMLFPIELFEFKCKELIKLIKEVEAPIQSGIKVFDEAKKEEKRQAALKLISEVVESLGLGEKYARRLIVLDNYMNLTAKPSTVKKDIEQRAYLLLQEEAREQELLQIIKDTIANANKSISTPLKLDDFQSLIDMNMPTNKLIQEINRRADLIKQAEKPKEVITPIVQEPNQHIIVPQKPINETERIFYVEMHIEGSKEAIAKLGQFLKDNNYKYEKLGTGVV